MAEAHRRAFDRDDSQSEHALADRPALPSRLEQDGIAEQDQEAPDDQDDDDRARAGSETDEAREQHEPVEQTDAHDEVDELGERARRDARRLELEDDGFGGDDPAHLWTDHPYRHGHVPYRGPWTSTASS